MTFETRVGLVRTPYWAESYSIRQVLGLVFKTLSVLADDPIHHTAFHTLTSVTIDVHLQQSHLLT